MAFTRRTPGVFIKELTAFPPSVVGIQTAVPVFIGYTEKADISGKPVPLTPVRITSLADYEEVFGGEFDPIYTLTPVTVLAEQEAQQFDFKVFQPDPPTQAGWKYFNLVRKTDDPTVPRFNLYNSMRLFYDNGGGDCYVVSVALYKTLDGTSFNPVSGEALLEGLKAAGEQVGPTMIVIPEAVLLPKTDSNAPVFQSAEFQQVAQAMLDQCFTLKDRVAILDLYGTQFIGDPALTTPVTLDDVVGQFRIDVDVPNEQLNYGMAYFPFLHTSVVPSSDFDFTNITPTDAPDPTPGLKQILLWENTNLYGTSPRAAAVKDKIDAAMVTPPPTDVIKLNQDLAAALPLLGDMQKIMATKTDRLPPSGAMAGVFTYVDKTRGVWNAPANISLKSVKSTTLNLNNAQQEDLNVPVDGKAIDAIREFVGRGPVVWGARTLDGNSNDYRYIQVRRTLIYIEQSIKAALNRFVFAPNDGNTWVTVTSLISNFLQDLWSSGGLMGAKASDAFTVQCGLGSTMTGLDILNGYMIVQVTLQMIRPAEFIELTFKQRMEGVA